MSFTFPFNEDTILEFQSEILFPEKEIFYKLQASGESYILLPQGQAEQENAPAFLNPTRNSKEEAAEYRGGENLCMLTDCRRSGDSAGYLVRLIIKKFVDKVLHHETINLSYNRQVLEQSWKILLLPGKEEDDTSFIKTLKNELGFVLKNKTLLYYISSTTTNGKRSITFIGRTVNVTVEESNGVFAITRIFRNSGNNNPIGYILTNEFTITNYALGKVNKKLLEEVSGSSKYLDCWKEYLQYEINELSNYCKFKYTNPNVEEDDYRCYSLCCDLQDDRWERLEKAAAKQDDFFIIEEFPSELDYKPETHNLVQDFLTWESNLTKLKEEKKIFNKKIKIIRSEPTTGSILIQLEHEEKIPAKGWVIQSRIGEITQLKRQYTALQNLRTGRSKIPHLISLIENRELTGLTKGNLKLSQSVKKKIFPKTEPNESQRDAILLALNTPDIVLVQGPPGTGKTTVARAIAERKSELLDNARMSVLFSAYQHDAVRNILERTEINGFPVVKVGKKKGDNDWETTIAGWINRMKNKLTDYCVNNPANFIYREVIYLITGYIKNPRNDDQLDNYLKKLARAYPHPKIDALRTKLARTHTKRMQSNINENMIYAIRTTKQGVVDDGEIQLSLLKEEKWLLPEDKKKIDSILQKRIKNEQDVDEDYLSCCTLLKNTLLDTYKKGKKVSSPQINQDVITLLEELKEELDIKRKKEYSAENVTHDLYTEFTTNPYALEDAVLDYAVGIGSTTGQTVSNDNISRLTTSSDDLNDYSFNTTIIDEAARATPLDLFGAMNITSGQIVLVGDHRQLPHIFDEEIKKKIEDNNQGISEEQYLEKSFFEFMFQLLQEREKVDGIKRRITLNKQYRMIDTLGNFVSRIFYEPHGEGFSSPRGKEGFKQFAHYENKPLAWINVPHQKGFDIRNKSKSFERPIEVTVLMEEVKKIVMTGPDLEIGIITFYTGQAKLIEAEVKKTFKKMYKIKAGTVDSFQGLEFDVVFLSTVRSNRKRNFGFLQVSNRLCVAMSRQKSLLVVIGDRDMIENFPKPEQHPVKPLHEFSKLCREEGCNRMVEEFSK